MKEFIIGSNEAGQRFDKYLMKLLKDAPSSFIHKMLRKKNIVLNGKKSDGKDKLNINDNVKIFLSDETFNKFAGKESKKPLAKKDVNIDIIYEDSDIVLINKEPGILSQKADSKDDSINDRFIQYLINNGEVNSDSLKTFKPSICNRLDRNTSGLIIAGKSLTGLQVMASLLKERTLNKYYICVVKGIIKEKSYINGYLYKDEKSNKVIISDAQVNKNYSQIETAYYPLASNGKYTLLCVHLLTGKTHQIRAHLASVGHALVGDTKYGDRKINDYFNECYRLNHQLLHSYMLIFPNLDSELEKLSERCFTAPVFDKFGDIIKKEFKDVVLSKEYVWEHGIAEDLEVLR